MLKKFICLLAISVACSSYGQKVSTSAGPSNMMAEETNTINAKFQAEAIEEDIDEKKETKKALKDVLGRINMIDSYFAQVKPDIGPDFDKLKSEFMKEKTYGAIWEIQGLFLGSLGQFTERMYELNRDASTPELGLLLQSLDSRIEAYRNSFRTKEILWSDENGSKYKGNAEELIQKFDPAKYKQLLADLKKTITDTRSDITQKIDQLEQDIRKLISEKVKLEGVLEKKIDANETIFRWGFPVFIFFILLIFLLPLRFWNPAGNDEQPGSHGLYSSIYKSGVVTEIITVFLLTSTILLLGLTDKLTGEILGTLIGGISGYVLGRSFKSSGDSTNSK